MRSVHGGDTIGIKQALQSGSDLWRPKGRYFHIIAITTAKNIEVYVTIHGHLHQALQLHPFRMSTHPCVHMRRYAIHGSASGLHLQCLIGPCIVIENEEKAA